MRILSFTTLYPSAARPVHGIFVENRLRHLRNDMCVDLKVVAPVPYFPFRSRRFARYAAMAETPRFEQREDIDVYHPRFLTIPKIGMTVAPALLYQGARRCVRDIIASGFDFDVLDAHYFYPDGVAAALLAKEFNKPLTITARGTDLNLIPRYQLPRKQIQWAAGKADHLITVCEALKDVLIDLDVPSSKTTVLRNGVDLDVFHPADRSQSRADLKLKGFTLLTAGHLVERKGHHLIIKALKELPGVALLVAGDGEIRASLEALTDQLGLQDRVTFLGAVPHKDLYRVYSAVDALVLASDREGWPNVLLEAMACGTPVVATNVWGAGEIVQSPEAGLLVEERSPSALAESVQKLRDTLPDRRETRRYAEGFDWKDTSEGQQAIFAALASNVSNI